MSVYALTHHRTQVDTSGQLSLSNHARHGVWQTVGAVIWTAPGFTALVIPLRG